MREKEDLRIRKTRANLYKGILELMKTKKIEEISITDICKASMINRSTFYDHFTDKQDLLRSLIQDSKEELSLVLKNVSINEKTNSLKDYYLKAIENIMTYISKHSNIRETLWMIKKNDPTTVYNMLLEVFQTCSLEELKENYQNTSTTPIEITTLFYASGIATILLESLEESKTWDPNTYQKEWELLLPDIPYLKQKKES